MSEVNYDEETGVIEEIDSRPIEVQIAEALDKFALELIRVLTKPPEGTDLKTQIDAFKMAQDWLVKRKKAKGDSDTDDEAGMKASRDAVTRLSGMGTAPPLPKYGDIIDGMTAPEAKPGRPSRAYIEKRTEYERALEKAQTRARRDDDSELQSRLKQVGC